MMVHVGGEAALELVPAAREITIRDLLTHTSGLAYGHAVPPPVQARYEALGIDFSRSDGAIALEEMVDRLGNVPLVAQPGS